MKKTFRIPIVLFLVSAVFYSTPLYATNGHQLSAIGGYQEGMAGAVTAAPYDSSTAITNPAGMATIGTRADYSFQGLFPHRKLTYSGGASTEGGSEIYPVPGVGFTAPSNETNDAFFGIGMYGVSGMGVDFDTVSGTDIYSLYQFWKMAPTLAWKWETFALGISLNLDYQAFGFKIASSAAYIDLSEMQSAFGYGGAIGMIYQPSPAFGMGLAYISKQNFTDFKWRLSAGDVDVGTATSQDGIYTMDLDFPQQAAFGLAIRPFRAMLWTVDVKWINYSDTYDKVKLLGNFSGARELTLDFGWEDVWVYASALQFDITPNFAFRMGYNHSTSPIDRKNIDNNLAFPAIVQDHAAAGFTYRFGRSWEMTIAYMKAFKEEIISPTTNIKISLEEQAGDIEFSYRF